MDGQGVGFRVPVGSRTSLFPRRPDRFWGPPNILSNGYRELFPREWYSGRGVKLTTHLQVVSRSRIRGSIHPLLHTSSWRSAELLPTHVHVLLRERVLSVLYDIFSVLILFIYFSIVTFYWVLVYLVMLFQFAALYSCNWKDAGKRWIGKGAERNDRGLYKSVNPTIGRGSLESRTPSRNLNSGLLKDEVRGLTMIATPLAFQLPCYLYPCELWLHLQ
jgi:hypothetical protein